MACRPHYSRAMERSGAPTASERLSNSRASAAVWVKEEARLVAALERPALDRPPWERLQPVAPEARRGRSALAINQAQGHKADPDIRSGRQQGAEPLPPRSRETSALQ
jgi:hypothetical protein